MNNYTQYINTLRACAKEHESDITPLAHIKVSVLCRDAADLLERLKQEPKTGVLDNIRAEIMDTGAFEQEVHGKTEFLKGINYCLSVIDKYKTESEDKI